MAAATEAEVRELRSYIEKWPRMAHRGALLALCDSWLAQRDVVAAARNYVRLAGKVDELGVSIDTALHDAWSELCAAVAAVVSGTPEAKE
jgi:hypothetical protein